MQQYLLLLTVVALPNPTPKKLTVEKGAIKAIKGETLMLFKHIGAHTPILWRGGGLSDPSHKHHRHEHFSRLTQGI